MPTLITPLIALPCPEKTTPRHQDTFKTACDCHVRVSSSEHGLARNQSLRPATKENTMSFTFRPLLAAAAIALAMPAFAQTTQSPAAPSTAPAADSKPMTADTTKSTDTKSADTKATSTTSTDAKSTDKAVDAKTTDTKSMDAKGSKTDGKSSLVETKTKVADAGKTRVKHHRH